MLEYVYYIMSQAVISKTAAQGSSLHADDVQSLIEQVCPVDDYRRKRVLLIIPDGTRTAPIGLLFKTLHAQIGSVTSAFDVLIALGTHPPMSETAICARLEISSSERANQYADVRIFNHQWDNPDALRHIGVIPEQEIAQLSRGLFSMPVEVKVNRRLFDYDQVIIVGPVFPHEVVGFSGGNKYLFPGVSGPEILNFFHWLGAVITNPMIIGNKWTPVRRVVDRAAGMVQISKLCFCLVVDHGELAGLFVGPPEAAWSEASELSSRCDITYKDKPFHTILSCAPPMYDELWVAGKCMYKLEPVLADGGELIIYAPHLKEISVTHGKLIEEIGYHCRDYFLKQWDQFKNYPWGVLAHSTHVHGIGTYENGVEKSRARVTLATRLSSELCRKINFGYGNPDEIHPEDFANREDEGVLLVPKAGEMLFRLRESPAWASATE
jgi:lactate racemase